ncbi:MAG: Rrf2 family transcriptional regulator [Myxococcales bacterium]|nr:Rrf2 family transcriptional regulator [Myxococcales bacterium]
MRLTLHADYALRMLVYLAVRPDAAVTTAEIGEAYGISKHHLVRVAHTLKRAGYIVIAPGRNGGLALAKSPADIRIGQVVKKVEPDLDLVECFAGKGSACPITSVCALGGALGEALAAFLSTLDRYTLADVIADSGPTLAGLLVPADALRPARRKRA